MIEEGKSMDRRGVSPQSARSENAGSGAEGRAQRAGTRDAALFPSGKGDCATGERPLSAHTPV